MSKRKKTTIYDFLGGMEIPAANANGAGPFVKTVTGSGSVSITGGECLLALDATNEAQNVCLSMDNVYPFDVDDLIRVSIWARLSVALGAAAKVRMGLASARNDDPDAIATSLFFGGTGDADIEVEADDGTNELAAVDTGLDWSTTLRKFVFDFSEGILSQSPPTLSKGGKYNVAAKVENASGFLRRVAENSAINIGAHTTGLQLYAQIQKTATTNLGTLAISRIEVEHLIPG